jgi:hypothetical protein
VAFFLLFGAHRADTPTVKRFVAVAICALVVTAAAPATVKTDAQLLSAARLSGLPARKPVPRATFSPARYGALVARARDKEYPPALRTTDARLLARLGLQSVVLRQTATPTASRALYDPYAQKLLVQQPARPARARVVHELVRALVDQNFNLRRLRGLRVRDRDAALAARAMVDGTAALASKLSPPALRGSAADRFVTLESSAGLGPGRALASELRYLGGNAALRTALQRFPQTTEQLLHVDKFLERERALPVRLPTRIGELKLTATETFGELDVRNLLRALGVAGAPSIASGWGGGRVGMYLTPTGDTVVTLVLRWDTLGDAAEWRAAVPAYVSAAFPGAAARDCPPLDRCWSSSSELAGGVLGTSSIFVSGPGAAAVGTTLLHQN